MKVVVASRLSEDEAEGLRAAAPGAEVCLADGWDAVLAEVAEAEAYVPGPWNEDVLAAAPGLRWVHFLWAGLDGQLFPASLESEITITNSAGVFVIPMAEHVLALMLAFARAVHLCARRTPEQLWHAEGARASITDRMAELEGATLGILGYGGIGRAVAERARAFGMEILALRRRPAGGDARADQVWGPDRLPDLLARSDYLVISCALTPETRGLIGERELAAMKPNAVVINVARGAVIDEGALVAALASGRIAGAGLDVTAEEPLPQDSPLWQMDNVIITPHVSGNSPRTWQRQMDVLRENLRRYAAGEPLLNVVDKAAGY
ncbi:MAG: D-2-hydroxyacid dehydrogenase [Candidatus Brocadiae bacterium]|nr:D-2-hydroxyacid dehydrogenase [Candidatus Brocadiia bacterium]